MKLIAARTGQEYYTRKQSKGAFGEDRYHATAIEKIPNFEKAAVGNAPTFSTPAAAAIVTAKFLYPDEQDFQR
jgi:hypothetical protein